MQVQRLLPTPPQANPMINGESPERNMSPPLLPQHLNLPNPHYPRPINRAPPPFLTKYPDINLQMNDILAEIERADSKPVSKEHSCDPPPVTRRTSNATSADNQLPRLAQTPPLRAITARTSVRSFPIQEEPEDDPGAPSKKRVDTRVVWKGGDQAHHDLSPEGRYEEGGQLRYLGGEDEESYTPRSPTSGFPEHYGQRNVTVNDSQTVHTRGRDGPSDQLGLRSFDPAVFEQGQQMLPGSKHPQRKYVKSRRPAQNDHQQPHPQPQSQQPQSQLPQSQQQREQQQSYHPWPQNPRFHDPRESPTPPNDVQYHPSSGHPDDYFDDPVSSYIQSYIQSARPDAPIPPTPHSRTLPPSSLISGGYDYGGKPLPVTYTPVPPTGSPYPFPFSHVRRTQQTSGLPNPPGYDHGSQTVRTQGRNDKPVGPPAREAASSQGDPDGPLDPPPLAQTVDAAAPTPQPK
jgi:hypothetical protein